MRILITGATGFIGSHLADVFAARGDTVRCLVRKSSSLQWVEPIHPELVYGDLFDGAVLDRAVDGVDGVYHVAGLTKARTAQEYDLGNHVATRNLLEAVVRTNPGIRRFVHVSSQAAVGPSTGGDPVDERTEFHPITAYGISKMEAEKECLAFMDRVPITIVRPPAVYGPREKDIFAFFESVNKGLQPMIGLSPKSVSLIHVKDLVDGIVLAGEHQAGIGQTYFISSERAYTWREVGEVTAKAMGKKVIRLRVPVPIVYAVAGVSEFIGLFSRKPVLLNFEKARDIVQDSWTCSIDKAKREIGYRECMALESGIRGTVEWYRKQGWLK